MRVFVASSFTDRGKDAMANNPGNLYFTHALGDNLPLICPYTRDDAEKLDADYIVCGPDKEWALIRDHGAGHMEVVHGPIPSLEFGAVRKAVIA